MAPTDAEAFSFQPWAHNGQDEGALQSVLVRVNMERGHFRDITEASLQEEIAADGALEISESESEGDWGEAEESKKFEQKPKTREDFLRARHEMLVQVSNAQQELAYSLDFISLLQSKDASKSAQTTLSPALKAAVPMGTLGTDVWKRMPVHQAREAQDELLATNVRMHGLQQSADGLLAAATRLQNNVRKETEYWNQILSISEDGWKVCRILSRQHRLGVSYGFSESAPQFSRRGIAELAASSGGSIMIERAIGSKPKSLRAVLMVGSDVVGSSRLPQIPEQEETTLEARIRYARDSLFDEELYYEMLRESRTITSLGVSMKDSSIELDLSTASASGLKVFLSLETLDQHIQSEPHSSENHYDALAQAVVVAMRLLLSQAHRDRLKKRSELPKAMSEKNRDDCPTLPILRPVMSFILHRSALDRLNSHVENVTRILEKANIENSHQFAGFRLTENQDVISAEALINLIMRPLVSEAHISIKNPKGAEARLEIRVETTLAFGYGSVFLLNVSPGTRRLRLDSMDEIVEATDTFLASILAQRLAEMLGGQWKCNASEALITKDGTIDQKGRSVEITFDTKQKSLALDYAAKKVVWKGDDNTSVQVFWDATEDFR